jgi:HEAT repeat protein
MTVYKYLILLLLFFLPAFSVMAEESEKIVSVHTGFNSACEAAASDKALILVLLSTSKCKECITLKNEVFSNPDFIEKGYPLHLVEINLNREQKYVSLFQISIIPELVLVTSDLKIVARTNDIMDTESLLAWLKDSRIRNQLGEWEGTVSEAPQKTSLSQIGKSDDLKSLVSMLGSASITARARAEEILDKNQNSSMEYILTALADPYLGIRIGVHHLLCKWAPGIIIYNPWANPEKRKKQIQVINAWWESEKNFSVPDIHLPDKEKIRTIKEAISNLQTNSPAKQTKAMSVLVNAGIEALPMVKEKLEERLAVGDQKTVRLLEDIRWAIIIPDRVEERIRVRRVLARGTSEERQAAVLRLGEFGNVVLPAIQELLNDADPLVRETTVLALTKIGNDDALASMALMLKSTDSNLRMVAAQELGRTKNKNAGKYLAQVINDPDETVAIVAIAALEECKAKEQGDVLIKALTDKRWRVRAAAAKVLGELSIIKGSDQLIGLLRDTDEFVVKNVLEAINKIGVLPDNEILKDLAKRTPVLTELIVKILVGTGKEKSLTVIETIYINANDAGKRATAAVLAKNSKKANRDNTVFISLLKRLQSSPDPFIRHQAVIMLNKRSLSFILDSLMPFLNDPSPKVRDAASVLIVQLLAHLRGYKAFNNNSKKMFGLLNQEIIVSDLPKTFKRKNSKKKQEENIRHVKKYKIQIDQWHKTIKKFSKDEKFSLKQLLALSATCRQKNKQFDLINRIFSHPGLNELKDSDFTKAAILITMAQIPWPEGEKSLAIAVRNPLLYSLLLQNDKYARREVNAYVRESSRFVTSMESATGETLSSLLELFLKHNNSQESLHLSGFKSREITTLLIHSQSAVARAVGVFSVNRLEDKNIMSLITENMKDSNPWVRKAAISSFYKFEKEQGKKEQILAPLLKDPEPKVSDVAVISLLKKNIQNDDDLKKKLNTFTFENVNIYITSVKDYFKTSYRPFSVTQRKPDFLPIVRELLINAGDSSERIGPLTLLLAQYGDFSGFERGLSLWKENPTKTIPRFLLQAVVITKDEKYIEPLAVQVERAETIKSLKQYLKYLRRVPGKKARILRRRINQRLRSKSF